ncbi:MAG: glutamate--tRNA ligase [Eubacteriales bacterium]|nr:glutamate--tRNA ligase [Eubacteriales bacterium]
MNYEKLAELLFPTIDKTPEDYEKIYPPRSLPEGAMVTRLAPSPTGFMHLGNLYGAFVDERLAHQTGGVFFLRIEDTDDKRYVEGAVDVIIQSLDFYGIHFDEGAGKDGDRGDYGDYTQSHRAAIYQAFAKRLVQQGDAYPCFLTEEEISGIREKQEQAKATPGIYGKYASCRDLTFEEIEENLKNGKPYVLRLRSDGLPPEEQQGEGRKILVKDAIRGMLEMPANFMDVVLLKTNGIPTYHFAHVVDDHLMRTTHVVRGAEWLPSLPIHVEIFEKLGLPLPIYCHTAQLMKIDEETGKRRKLSKRKDPELSLTYYRNEGYHPLAVREYLLTILNSNFEEWRTANPDADADEFQFTTEKMSSSGALFDLDKLNDISKDTLLRITAHDLFDFLKKWSDEFAPEYKPYFEDRAYLERILDLGRKDRKPRKDLVYARQIMKFISYFFDDFFEIEDTVPDEVSKEDASEILRRYLETYDHSDDNGVWFEKIRKIASDLGYAAKPKDYKKHPDEYKGHVGHVSTVIRVALMGRRISPDIWEIQQILGEDRTRARLEAFIGQNQ